MPEHKVHTIPTRDIDPQLSQPATKCFVITQITQKSSLDSPTDRKSGGKVFQTSVPFLEIRQLFNFIHH